MRKRDIAKRLAEETGVTNGEAADQVDRLVNDVLQKLRDGQPAQLPGLGLFRRSPEGNIELVKEKR
jgi:nucleoid DNA-binding protein